MSDFEDFRHSLLLRHPTTWLLAAVVGVWGGANMYVTREAKRAAGADLHWSSISLERTVDFAFGALVEICLVMCAVWMLAGIVENLSAWRRFAWLLAVYGGIVLLKFVLW